MMGIGTPKNHKRMERMLFLLKNICHHAAKLMNDGIALTTTNCSHKTGDISTYQ
jgi:hypothetical protein